MNTRTERHTTRDGFVEVGIVEHNGREYASGGASVSDTHLVCYPRPPQMVGTVYANDQAHGQVTNWGDEVLGTYRITGYAGGFNGVKLTCYRVRLDDGREYVGRGLGPGMILECRRAAKTCR